ncbi:MAG: ABC transporter ATP-binding protein/permease [Lachnospiraceae bacterium]|nr:ABC transporter ATP-binding protein/permease [Lachnospiraceae bacterium]
MKNEKEKKQFPLTKLQWLWANMKGLRVFFFLGILGTVVYNIMQLTVPFFASRIVDIFLTGENAAENLMTQRNLFYMLLAGMVGMTFLRTVIVYVVCMDFEKVSQGVLYRLRNILFRKIEKQDMQFYATYRTGDLMTRVTGDLDAVRHMIAWVVRMIVEAFSLMGATIIYFWSMNWKLAISLMIVAPFIFLIIVLFRNNVAPKHRLLREKMSEMNTAAQENIAGNRVVKAFSREPYEIEKFDRKNRDYSETNQDTAMTWLRYFPFIETFANLMPVVLLLVGGLFLMQGELTMGEFVAFSGLIWGLANPMRQLGSIMNEFQRFSAASAKIMEIYYSEPHIVDPEDPVPVGERLRGEIEFRHVSFEYLDENAQGAVLTDISFHANPGETIAIMGETGCGKTTLVHLIPRFYDPSNGQVLIDGVETNRYRLHDLRKNIGMATQDVLLYSDTIDGNIAYGNSQLSHQDIIKFAKYSAAASFISKMPDGYDTVVGERGVGLSGGQKQRISLARALAIRPSILILDDTTSAVDLETEKQIQESLNNLDFQCTKIIIAQRISTTKNADKILILRNGLIEEAGTHEELLAKKGYYYQAAMLQMGEEALVHG